MKRKNGFVIAAAGSGSGKTTLSLGIMAWLTRNGYQVAPFKVGPDFIDPGHHTRITGTVSRNLDGWMLSKQENIRIFSNASKNADIAVVEGVMGLFDGYDGKSEAGSTAQMAKWLDLPVLLVVNAKSMARSAAALIKGFTEFDPDLKFKGVIFNNLGSKNHFSYLTEAVSATLSIPVIGGILRDSRIAMPERHLGLVTDDEHMLGKEDISYLSGLIEQGLDTRYLTEGATPSGDSAVFLPPEKKSATVKIGIARDKAFCFYYQDNFDLLEQFGAEPVFFSPVADETLPQGISGIYLGGGYPEVFAKELSQNTFLRTAIKSASDRGMPIYGECGGLMYLCRSFTDENQVIHDMTGCFPFITRMRGKLAALGYRDVVLKENTLLGPVETFARGHEFHYSEIVNPDEAVKTVYRISGRGGKMTREEGYQVNNTLGSYVHLHFGSNPGVVEHFINACRKFNNSPD